MAAGYDRTGRGRGRLMTAPRDSSGGGSTDPSHPSPASQDFATLYQTQYGRVASQLFAYLGDRSEAEDITQEAFLRAWQRWDTISRYDDPVAWVRRVAFNLGTSRWRRIVAGGRALRRQGVPDPVPAVDPEHVALVAALRKLPERQRLAVVLHYLADLPVKEVAVQTGAATGTVVSWLHRARARLATLLSDTDLGGPQRSGKEVSKHG